jgi:hypothetical protein
MLRDLDNMEASCVFYINVGKLIHLEQSKTASLTVNTTGIVRLTVHHDFIFGVSFLYYPGVNLRETSADVISPEQSAIYH